MRSLSRRPLYRSWLLPLTATAASAIVLGSAVPADAACYWNREGQFCDSEQAPVFGTQRNVHRLSSAGLANTYRTLCVRSCDGYYFPISYATGRGRFKTDAAVCASMYPPGEA